MNGSDPNGSDPNGRDPNGSDPNGRDPNGGDPNGGGAADPGRDPADAFCELDDTLVDGPAVPAVPAAAREWLASQRYVHGLLRTLHTADAAAREARVTSVLERINAEGAPPRRRWLLVALVALLLAVAGVFAGRPAALPTAEATMQRAVAEMARDVNRRFRVQVSVARSMDAAAPGAGTKAGDLIHHEFALVARPGRRFRIDGKLAFAGFQLGDIRIGSDGSELWVMPANGAFRRAAPLADRERLMQGFGDVLDLGYLDVHDLVQKLPDSFELRVVGRELDQAGRSLLRLQATQQQRPPQARFRSAWLLCEESTGMVTHVVVEVGRGLTRRFEFEYLGEEPPGLVDFKRPW